MCFTFAVSLSEKGGASLDHAWTLILFQILLIVGMAHWAGAVAVRWNQPRVVGEMVAGLMLGPSLLGWIFPDFYRSMIAAAPRFPLSVLSQIGLIFLLFQVGMEFEFSHLRSAMHRQVVTRVWIVGIVIPFILGAGLGYGAFENLHPTGVRSVFAIFMGIALSITAMPVLARILMEQGLEKSKIGVMAISCAAMGDIAAWLMLAVAMGFARADLNWGHQIVCWIGLLAYGAAGWWGVRPWIKDKISLWMGSSKALPHPVFALVLSLLFCSAICTQMFGIGAVFGAFYLGVLLHDQKNFTKLWRETVSPLVMVFFVPIFFTFTGLKADIPGMNLPGDLLWLIVIVGAATLGKWGACYAAARWSGMDHAHSQALGVLMNTRGLMELVIANAAYDVGAISQRVFTMLVVMAVLSTVITGPILQSLLRKHRTLLV